MVVHTIYLFTYLQEYFFEYQQENGMALQFASPEVRGDQTTCLMAVKQNGMSLNFAQPVR